MIWVFDDLLDQSFKHSIEQSILKQTNWHTHNNASYIQGINLPQSSIREKEMDGSLKSSLSNIIQLLEPIDNVPKLGNISRIKINKLSPIENKSDEKYNVHIDSFDPHYSMIYYMNDSDGDTVFYKDNLGDKLSKWVNYASNQNLSYWDEWTRVEAKSGRIVLFDGSVFHHASYPTKGDRYIVNFNIKKPLKLII